VYNNLFIIHVAIYLIGAIAALFLHKNDKLSTYAAFISASVASIIGIIFAYTVISGDTYSFTMPGSSLLTFNLTVDKLSAFFIFILSLVVFAVSIYSISYVKEYYGKKNIGYLGFLYNIFIISMVLVISAGNAIMFLIVWELMSILSYFLVIYEHEKEDTRKAGFMYIVMTHVGTGFIILSFLILASASGSFSFESFHTTGTSLSPLLKNLVFVCALIGFGTKAGIVPFHIWLPYAHPAAPSNVSALMSGVMIKTAIYMFIRVFFDFLGAGVLWWGILLLVIATVSSILGVMYALMQHDIKRLLAFHSIENIGIILIGISIAMIFTFFGKPQLAALALIAGLYHTLNHAVFKSLLFMGAGSMIYSTHTRNIEEMGGLIKKMPWTALFFLVGSVSIIALPPFNGFVSEWLTFQSQLLSIQLTNNMVTIIVLFSGAGLALTGALAAMCFAKAFGIGFLALPRSAHAEHAREVPFTMLAGMGLMSLACLVLGIMPQYVIRIIDSVSVPIVGASISSGLTTVGIIPSSPHIATTVSSGFGSISTTWIALLMVFLVLAMLAAIALLLPKKSACRYETWGCGQPVMTARNEYSATAFTNPIKIWFASIYRGQRDIQTTYSASRFFKSSIKFESHIESVFERYLYAPIIDLTMTVSRTAKMIQSGSIHAYIAYIFVTLMVLLMYVLIGAN